MHLKQAVQELRNDLFETRRPTVQALEDILYEPIPLLDHGFIRVIDYMGDDNAIVQAARVSYGKGTKQINEDKGLINYLLRHWHTTPFEMCEIKFHVKMPIFVARQWLRHRTANVNEYSARYSILDKEFYLPELGQLAAQSKSNKQGRDEVLDQFQAQEVLEILKNDAVRAYDHYQEFLNENEAGDALNPEKSGIARELARINLPVNFYTQMYWKVDLHNWMHFLRLRADDHAQYEIRVYAQAMLDVFQRWLPLSYQAFCDYRLNAVHLSAKGLKAIQCMLKGENVDAARVGMSVGEWREFQAILEKA